MKHPAWVDVRARARCGVGMLLGVVAYVERRDDLPAVDACLRCLPWSGLLDMPALIRAERRRLRELARVPRR